VHEPLFDKRQIFFDEKYSLSQDHGLESGENNERHADVPWRSLDIMGRQPLMAR
jgi:hypothetical protein